MIEYNCDCFGLVNSQSYNNKSGNFTSKVINGHLFWFPVNVFWPKFAAAGLPTNSRNVQLASFFSALFLLLVGSGPKRSMPIEKLGSSSLVSSIFKREGKLHCGLTGRKAR